MQGRTHNCGELRLSNAGEQVRLAVSYTHLDVYKRQTYNSSERQHKSSYESITALNDRINARMTCIGQSKFRASSEYVHLQCTHQPTHESSLRSLQVIAAQFISIVRGCCRFQKLLCCFSELS